jgi:hypothetical protein
MLLVSQAVWARGYWVRNMQQGCYTGVHRSLYMPIGIACVLFFCLCPLVMYFLMTYLYRRQFNETRIRIQYGFLYLQYK